MANCVGFLNGNWPSIIRRNDRIETRWRVPLASAPVSLSFFYWLSPKKSTTSSNVFIFFFSFLFFFFFTVLNSIKLIGYSVLLGFTGFDWVFGTGSYWVLPSFTEFYWVLLGFTGFYWVLLGFTGFDWV